MSEETKIEEQPKAVNPEVAVESVSASHQELKEEPIVPRPDRVQKHANKSAAQLEEENHKLLKETMAKKASIHELRQDKADLEAALEKIREDDLAAQGKWEELYKAEKVKADNAEREVIEREQRLLDNHKLQAVTEKLKFKKPEYKAFVDRNAIVIDEKGHVTEDSLEAEVERLRQSHNELLDTRPKSSLPNFGGEGNPEKPLGEMSQDEMVKFIMDSGVFKK